MASAPVVAAGIQQFGNTSTFADSCQNGYEFWTLQLEQGDLVKITWASPAAVDTLAVWSPGTVDASHESCLYASGWSGWTAAPVFTDTNVTPSTSRVSQTVATATGSYPLLFLDTTGAQNAGPYAFTAVVLHKAAVTIPHVSTFAGKGEFPATAAAPDNSPISDPALRLTLRGWWSAKKGAPARPHTLATASPVNGDVIFDYTVPTSEWGKKIRVDIAGGGASYQRVKTKGESVKVVAPSGTPVLLSAAQLQAASRVLGQPIYWAGPRKGFSYEFTLTQNGYAFVRYLPHGVRPGDPTSKYQIVATYPLSGAYAALKHYAKGKESHGPGGSIYFVKPGHPTNVYVAFPRVDYEMEIYDPSPAAARALATSGRLAPVG